MHILAPLHTKKVSAKHATTTVAKLPLMRVRSYLYYIALCFKDPWRPKIAICTVYLRRSYSSLPIAAKAKCCLTTQLHWSWSVRFACSRWAWQLWVHHPLTYIDKTQKEETRASTTYPHNTDSHRWYQYILLAVSKYWSIETLSVWLVLFGINN